MRDPFPVCYKKVNGRKFTREQYLSWLSEQHRREAIFILNQDRKARILKAYIDSLPETNHIQHSHVIPIGRRRQPTRRELEAGIPVCCGYDSMEISAFDDGLWWCRHCRKSRMR